jgi:hypothetical protein
LCHSEPLGEPVPSPSRAALLPKVRAQFAEFLNQGSLVHLGLLSQPTCVGLRYGHPLVSLAGFSRRYRVSSLAVLPKEPARTRLSVNAHGFCPVNSLPAWTALVSPRNLSCRFLRQSNDQSVVQDYQPDVHRSLSVKTGLRPDSPVAEHPCDGTLRLPVVGVRTPLLCYSFRHSHSTALHSGLRCCFVARSTLPYHAGEFLHPALRHDALPRWIVGAALLDQ